MSELEQTEAEYLVWYLQDRELESSGPLKYVSIRSDVRDRLVAALRVMEWVDVKIPPEYKFCDLLGCGPGVEGTQQLTFNNGGFWFPDDFLATQSVPILEGMKLIGIEYWMPLPDPPTIGIDK